jgi:hypothetical protein
MPNDYRYLIPALLVGVMVLIFVLLSWSFFDCPKLVGCEQLDGKLISVIDSNKQRTISNAAANLNTNSASNQSQTNSVTPTTNNLAAFKEQVEKLKEDSEKLPESTLIKGIDKLQKEVEGGTITNTSTNNGAIPARLTRILGGANSSANADGKEELTTEEKEKKELRESLRVRYSSRVSWVLLTTLLCALFLGIVWFASHVMIEALKTENDRVDLRMDRFKFLIKQPSFWIAIGTTAVVALILSLIGISTKSYMPIADPMFKETIYSLEGISGTWFGFSNGIVFAAVVFLVATSCAIYYKVRTLNNQTKENREKTPRLINELAQINTRLTELTRDTLPLTADELREKNGLETKKSKKTMELKMAETDLTDKYKDWQIYSKGLLYIGGAMLTVGLFRVQIVNDWHIAFVDSGSKELLTEFFKTSLYNQAVFYTVLLMAIYLPIVYALPETADSPTVENSFKDKGFFATLMTFAPQIITLLSPVLLAPLANFFKLFFGN